MFGLVYIFTKAGLRLGLLLLETGILLWVVSCVSGRTDFAALSAEIIKGSTALIAITILLYLWG